MAIGKLGKWCTLFLCSISILSRTVEPETDKTVKLLFDSSQHVKPYMSRVVSIYFTPTERAEEQDQGPDETENQEPHIKTVGTFISTNDFLKRNSSLVQGHKAQKMYSWLLYTLHSLYMGDPKPQQTSRNHANETLFAIVQPTKVLVNEELFAYVLSFMNSCLQHFEDTGCFADTNHDTRESDVAHFLDQLHNARPIDKSELARPSEAEIELRDTLLQWSRAAENHRREYQRDTIRAYTEFERGEKTKIEYRQAIEKIEQEYEERWHQLKQTCETLTKNSDLKAETDNEQNAPLVVSPSNNTPSNIPAPSVTMAETPVDSSPDRLQAQAQPKHNAINYYADAHTATIQLIPACVTTTGLCVLIKYRDNLHKIISRYLKKITKIFKKTRKKTRRKTAHPSAQPESKKIQKY